MNNLMQLDIACASLNIEDAIDLLGQSKIDEAEEHLYDAMSLLSEFFSQAHVDHIESNKSNRVYQQ